jgi:hypothetical protein
MIRGLTIRRVGQTACVYLHGLNVAALPYRYIIYAM